MTDQTVESPMAGSAARGAGVTMAGQLGRVLIQTVSVVVLTRLLAPEDYGLLAMVLVIVALGELFREFGLTAAAVQSTALSSSERTTLFWVNSIAGGLISVVVASLSGVIANIYGDSRLVAITIAISPIFLLNGLAAQFRATLMREIRFIPIALADTVAQLLGFVGALVCIQLLEFGYWSLVVQQLLVFSTTTTILILASRWRPGFVFQVRGMRRLYSFGVDYTLTQVLVYLSQNVSILIIGRNFGPTEVGYFSRALQLASLPITQISGPATNVSLPALSRLKNDTTNLLRYAVAGQMCITHLIALLAGFSVPIMGGLVDSVFGTRWAPMSDLLSFLIIASVFQALSFPTFWIFVSLGLTRSNLYYAICTRTVQILALLIAASVSIWASALMIAITSAALWPFGLMWLRAFHKIPILGLLGAGVRAVLIYGTASMSAWLVVGALRLSDPLSILFTSVIYLLFCASLAAIPINRRDYRQMLRIMSQMRRPKAKGHESD